MGLHFITKKLKKMKHEDSIQIMEIVQYTLQTLIKYNTNEYMLEWYRKVIDVLINDAVDDESRLLHEQKCQYLVKFIQKVAQISIEKVSERKENALSHAFVERVFEQSLQYFEQQTTMLSDHTMKLFEQLYLNLKGKRVTLKQRLFAAFERMNGPGIYKKLQFFFGKHLFDDSEKLYFLQSQS